MSAEGTASSRLSVLLPVWHAGQARAHALWKVAAHRLAPLHARLSKFLFGGEEPSAGDSDTDLEGMISENPPRFLRATMLILTGMCVFAVATASLVHTEIIVQSTGQLTIDVPPIVIQPMERSIVRALNVKVGDSVIRGQQLATLDATFAQADLSALRLRHRALQAQIRRMEAEWSGAAFEILDPTDTDERLQHALLRQRQNQLASRVKAFDEEINRFEANARTIDGQRGTLSQQLAVVAEIEDMRSRLFKLQSGSRMQLLLSQDARLRAEREHRDAVDRLTELQFATQSKRAERQAFLDDWKRSLLEELDRARAEGIRTKEALVKAERMHDLVLVSAPDDGVVLDIAKRSVGSVLREAEPFMTIMPAGAELIAEVLISSADIGYAKIGDEVVLKVDAFPYQKHGSLKGRLITIGEESFTPGNAPSVGDTSGPTLRQPTGVFHRARVAIVDTHLSHMPKGVRLLAGMTVAGEIKVGSRRVISYFLYPVTRGLNESIREP